MRKRRAVKRDVLPDPIYNSKVVTKLVNTIMIGGKKGTAQKILYDAFAIVEKQTKDSIRYVDDYKMPNVSEKVVRIIMSYTDYVNRNVWKK